MVDCCLLNVERCLLFEVYGFCSRFVVCCSLRVIRGSSVLLFVCYVLFVVCVCLCCLLSVVVCGLLFVVS